MKVTVTAEDGFGKTRIINEFNRTLAAMGCDVEAQFDEISDKKETAFFRFDESQLSSNEIYTALERILKFCDDLSIRGSAVEEAREVVLKAAGHKK